MRILKLTLCLALLAACQDQENRVISNETSPNGLAFTYMPITEKGVTDVTFAAFWKSNWITQPDANTTIPGIGALALSNGGTVDLPPQKIQALFQEKNSYANITPLPHGINAEIEIPIDYFDEILPVANELLVHPQFDPAWLNRIQAGEKERLASLLNNPDLNLSQALYANIWHEHPLLDYYWIRDPENQISGAQDSFQKWHKSTFGLDNVTLVVTGPASVKQAGRALDQLLDGLPKTSESFENLPKANPVQAKRIYLVQPDQQATKILMFGEMASNSLDTEFEDILFANLFGGGPDSTLF